MCFFCIASENANCFTFELIMLCPPQFSPNLHIMLKSEHLFPLGDTIKTMFIRNTLNDRQVLFSTFNHFASCPVLCL